jgi:hypothetical protein
MSIIIIIMIAIVIRNYTVIYSRHEHHVANLA